jgi:polyribonucleotide nucleotidyltransferase
MVSKHTQSIELGGKTLTMSVGKLALQSTVSVHAQWGDTTLLAVVTVGKTRDDIDYFPLSVEYVEKLYAGGIIKGSRWVKREGKPTDEAVLKGRVIDRSIRPLFPKSYRKEVQVVIMLLSVDGVTSADILAANAVSAALHLSNAPWSGPTATSRVGYAGNTLIAHPTMEAQTTSELDLVVTSVDNRVNMIETKAQILSERVIEDGIKLAKEENNKVIEMIEAMRKAVGMPKDVVAETAFEPALMDLITGQFGADIDAMIKSKASKENHDPDEMNRFVKRIQEKEPEKYDGKIVAQAVDYIVKKKIREFMISKHQRLDGRALDEIRQLSAEVALVPRIHGSGLFQRGDTQTLSITTLGTPNMEQLLEGPDGQESKRYIHHYNFPPYSVGEVGRIGFTNRREIGHGALAEKAIEPVLPTQAEFPYTIRVVSEVLGSNGSTSMASTCGSSLSLMDAGVPIKAPVAGLAMGIVSNSDDDYIILTDIMGIEDFSGEMDFKVAGTATGITAIQLDVKNAGLTDKMIHETMARALTARLKILEVMNKAIPQARMNVSEFAPKIVVVPIPEDKVGEVIGPGGKTIRGLIKMYGVQVDVEDDAKVFVSGISKQGVDDCARHIANMTRDILPGEKHLGKVTRVESYGAFVEIVPGKQGLVHISRLANGFVRDANDLVKVGDDMEVEVYEIDEMGRINIKPVTPFQVPEQSQGPSGEPHSSYGERPREDRGPGGDRGGRGGGHFRGHGGFRRGGR